MPEVIFNGPDGRLEGRYHHGKAATAPLAILLHPHPKFGGTMNSKVIYGLYQVFAEAGFSVLRFNFRGVGRSQGAFDNGPGELADAASALDWLQASNPNSTNCWVAGFSFGAWIGMQMLMRRPEITRFIAVSPPANINDFTFLAPCPASGLIVHGGKDQVVPSASVEKLVQKLSSQKSVKIDYRVIHKADHFFQNHLNELGRHVDDYVAKSFSKKAA